VTLFETLITLLLVAALLLQLSRRLRLPYPTLLALAGAGVAFFPWSPELRLDPHLALVLFVAPAILDAGYDTSPHELKRDWFPLIALALFAVLLTAAAVALAGWAFAGLPVAAAIALGAIVAPPDAAAASATLNNRGLPRRTLSLLQGESLLNDAVALLIFTTAVSIASAETLDPLAFATLRLLAVPGGLLLGLLAGLLFVRMWAIWAGTLSSTILEFIATFALWLLAERLHLSPILAIVAYAMVLARHAPLRQSARDRVHSYSVWAASVFILNVFAFLLMGLQARQIIQSLARRELWDAVTFAGLVFLIVVVVRIVWVMNYRRVLAPFVRRAGEAETGSRALRVLVAWCGMRGILTLATAFSLPYNFPGRDVIVLSAFAVVLGTLVIQGSTVTLLLRWLGIPKDGTMDDDIRTGRAMLAEAGLAALGDRDGKPVAAMRARLRSVVATGGRAAIERNVEDSHLQLEIIAATRRALDGLHRRGEIAEDAFLALQEELDWAELAAAPRDDREIAET
jgi:Na+/H+ antiporter